MKYFIRIQSHLNALSSSFVQRKKQGWNFRQGGGQWRGDDIFSYISSLLTYFCFGGRKNYKIRKRFSSSAIGLLWTINRLPGGSLEVGGLFRPIAWWRPLEWAGDIRAWGGNWIVCTFCSLSALISAWRVGTASQRCCLLDESESMRLTLSGPSFYKSSRDLVLCFHGILIQINGFCKYAYLIYPELTREFKLSCGVQWTYWTDSVQMEIKRF